jgi:hypothetical protein
MPINDITQEPKTMSRYDVVGKWSESFKHFITHVALLDEDKSSVKSGDEVSAVHMRPPLKRGDKITVNVGGFIPLTNDERKQIETWIETVNDESRGYHWPEQYVIHPPWKDEYDSNTGIRRYRRYSCAGFVLDSHLQININLLNINEDVLPLVDRETIISAYPPAEGHPDLLIKWGLKGNGPWKVVLAGYVLHALDRPTDKIRNGPYQAKSGDERF